jgi:hypothetical protein
MVVLEYKLPTCLLVRLRSKQKYKETVNGVLCDAVNRVDEGVLYFQNVIWVLNYTHNYNSIYTHKKSTAFLAPIFMKLKNAQHNYIGYL